MSTRKQQMVRLKFEGKGLEDLDFFTKSDPFLILSRPAKNGAGFVQVRKTETIRNNLNPSWQLLYIPTSELCDNNHHMPLNIEVYDEDRNSRNDFIGSVQLTLSDLQNLSQSRSPVILRKGQKNRGQLLVTECQIEEPTSDLERKGSIAAYPARRESVYSSPGDLAQSQSHTDIAQQAAAHHLLGQGQDHYPAYQPQGQYNPQYQAGPAPPFLGNHRFPNDSFLPCGPAPPFLPSGPAPYQHNQSGPSYLPTSTIGYTLPHSFPPPIPEDPTDTRPPSIWM
eukprot:GFUD01001466.1.p1 GENE.GFUD01001466.1~~GFUD01001466.1.p1  ORF type:complete len:281 (-),score=70.18 GFUD01001466.1:49-891(-)